VPLTDAVVADLCAEFEAAVAESVADRVRRAIAIADHRLAPNGRHLVVAGGVAANMRLRAGLAAVAQKHGYALHVPPASLCTDNAVMVAWAGAEQIVRGGASRGAIQARARWPLDPDAIPALGAGRLGAKA